MSKLIFASGLWVLVASLVMADTRVVEVGLDFSLSFRDTFSLTTTTVIDRGDTVRWQWISGSHTTMSNTGLWNAPLHSGSRTFSFTFNNPGTFNYQCGPHGDCCQMMGRVRVRIPGDVNFNCVVDDTDLLAVLFAFGQTGRNLDADLNYDQVIDDADLLKVLFHFGEGC
jgi:hypothetical protein